MQALLSCLNQTIEAPLNNVTISLIFPHLIVFVSGFGFSERCHNSRIQYLVRIHDVQQHRKLRKRS